MPKFSFDPNPAEAGKPLTITYTGPAGTTINLTWTPTNEPSTAVTRSDGTVTITVPEDAEFLSVDDGAGNESGTTILH